MRPLQAGVLYRCTPGKFQILHEEPALLGAEGDFGCYSLQNGPKKISQNLLIPQILPAAFQVFSLKMMGAAGKSLFPTRFLLSHHPKDAGLR